MAAAIRCAAGRALLRRAPGILRRAADVGERGALHQPIGVMSPASNRYISSYFEFEEYEKKKLAVALMKERGADNNEIENLDELLDLLKSNNDNIDQHTTQARAARDAIQEKKLELVSLLLRGDGGQEYKKKMEELAVAARRHRESLVLEDLKGKYKSLEELQCKMMIGFLVWGIPLTLVTMLAQSH